MLQAAPEPKAGQGYQIRIDAPAEVRAEEPFTATFVVIPTKPYHVTQNYPVEINFHAAGLEPVDQDVVAEELAVYTDDTIEASAKFKAATAGEHAILARARFSLCTDTRCDEVHTDYRLNIQVR